MSRWPGTLPGRNSNGPGGRCSISVLVHSNTPCRLVVHGCRDLLARMAQFAVSRVAAQCVSRRSGSAVYRDCVAAGCVQRATAASSHAAASAAHDGCAAADLAGAAAAGDGTRSSRQAGPGCLQSVSDVAFAKARGAGNYAPGDRLAGHGRRDRDLASAKVLRAGAALAVLASHRARLLSCRRAPVLVAGNGRLAEPSPLAALGHVSLPAV